jgi:DNA-binding NtrC family response regulator
MVNKTKFFKENIIRIFGISDISEACWEVLHYVQQYIPMEEISIYINPLEDKKLYLLAKITQITNELYRNPVPLNLPGYNLLRDRTNYENCAFIVNNPIENRLTNKIEKENDRGLSSFIILGFQIDNEKEGIIAFRTEKGVNYDQYHLNLLKMLRIPFKVALQNNFEYQKLIQQKRQINADNKLLNEELFSTDELIGTETGLKEVIREIRQIAFQNTPVLIKGEIGVEKEIIAQKIHKLSSNRSHPFITLNCSTISKKDIKEKILTDQSSASLDSIIPGEDRTTHTITGTIFLKNIDKLSTDIQNYLIELLKMKSEKQEKPDLRLICSATNDLATLKKQGQFKENLFSEINQFPIEIPPLRKRIGDIPALIKHYIQKQARQIGLDKIPNLAPDALDKLMDYQWPGNISELKALVQMELIHNPAGPLYFNQIAAKPETPVAHEDSEISFKSLEKVMKNYLKKVVDHTRGQIEGEQGAARILEMHPNTLRHRLKKFNIPYGRSWKKK